jgi:signal transduction histidine kinase
MQKLYRHPGIDFQQRVTAADCQLGWAFTIERDFNLSVVPWWAMTRVLRELVSNALAHAQAQRIDVQASVSGGKPALAVGRRRHRPRSPGLWGAHGLGLGGAHGLGLGGVRKRVKQMGGDVSWHENTPRGIVCRVTIPGFGPR